MAVEDPCFLASIGTLQLNGYRPAPQPAAQRLILQAAAGVESTGLATAPQREWGRVRISEDFTASAKTATRTGSRCPVLSMMSECAWSVWSASGLALSSAACSALWREGSHRGSGVGEGAEGVGVGEGRGIWVLVLFEVGCLAVGQAEIYVDGGRHWMVVWLWFLL